jgi:hypothetical protein
MDRALILNMISYFILFETEAKDLPYLLIKQKRMSSLLMENRAKTITKPLSGVHKKPHSNLPKTVSSRQRTSVIVITSP